MKRLALVGVVALLLYFPAANADHNDTSRYTGCLDIAGTGKGKISKVAGGDAPLNGACPNATGFKEIHVGDRLPPSCAGGEIPKFESMNNTWFCSTDAQGGSQGVAFSAFYSSMGPPQTVPAGTTNISMNNEAFDTGDDFVMGSFIAPVTGIYRFEARVDFTGTGLVRVQIGDGTVALCRGNEGTSTGTFGSNVSCLRSLNAGASMVAQIVSESGGDVNAGSSRTFFSGSLIS